MPFFGSDIQNAMFTRDFEEACESHLAVLDEGTEYLLLVNVDIVAFEMAEATQEIEYIIARVQIESVKALHDNFEQALLICIILECECAVFTSIGFVLHCKRDVANKLHELEAIIEAKHEGVVHEVSLADVTRQGFKKLRVLVFVFRIPIACIVEELIHQFGHVKTFQKIVFAQLLVLVIMFTQVICVVIHVMLFLM